MQKLSLMLTNVSKNVKFMKNKALKSIFIVIFTQKNS